MAKQIEDLTGQTFGDDPLVGIWTVLIPPFNKNGRIYALCQCICGEEIEIRVDALKRIHTKRCPNRKAHRRISPGDKFGRLTALEEVENTKGYDNHIWWKCQCSCNSDTIIVREYDLLNNRIKSCGCIKAEREKKGFGESTFNAVLYDYKRRANFLMTDDEAKQKMLAPCAYCGTLPEDSMLPNIKKSKYNNGDFIYNSLDKINPDGDYTVDNTNSCCSICNDFKSTYSIDEYFTWVKRVYEYLHLENEFMPNRTYEERSITPDDFNELAFSRKFKKIKDSARQRKKEFNLIQKDVRNKIFDNCFYCGIQPLAEVYSHDKKHVMLSNGIDRRDNIIGYIPENIVPCCDQCNYAKNTHNEEEFCNQIKKIYEYNNLKEYKSITLLHTHQMMHFTQIKNKILKEKAHISEL